MAPARQLGQRALAAGSYLCDLAEIHLETLSLLLPALRGRPECSAVRNSGAFFAWTILPFELDILDSHEAVAALHHQNREFEERAGQVAHSIYEDMLYRDVTLYFCSEDCYKEFLANPEYYGQKAVPTVYFKLVLNCVN